MWNLKLEQRQEQTVSDNRSYKKDKPDGTRLPKGNGLQLSHNLKLIRKLKYNDGYLAPLKCRRQREFIEYQTA